MDYLDYREQLGLGFNDEARVKYFFTSIRNCLNLLCSKEYNYHVSRSEYMEYCNKAGVSGDYIDSDGVNLFDCIIQSFLRCNLSINEFLFRYVAFINSIDEENNCLRRKDFLDCIFACFNRAHISMEVIEDDDGYFVFLAGAKELAEDLVNQQLVWIKDYPNTRERYAHALRKYAEKLDFPSNIVDEFRKTLESFFQEFFGSTKSLENLKSGYVIFLKEKGIPSEIANNLETLLASYTNYNNNYAKHQDKAEENVLEYIMYQTGIIIRLLITLKDS